MCSIYFLPTDFVPNVKDSNKSRFKKRSESNEAARQKTVLRDNAVPSNFPNAASYFSTLKQDALGSCQFPLSRVKTIMKSSPEVNSIGTDSVILVTKATELFIQDLAQKAYEKSANKSTLDYNDLVEIVLEEDNLQFLQDIIPRKIKFKEYLAMLEKGETIVIT